MIITIFDWIALRFVSQLINIETREEPNFQVISMKTTEKLKK